MKRTCPICRAAYHLGPRDTSMICPACTRSYYRWRRSKANSGDELDLMIWASNRARRSVPDARHVQRDIDREVRERVRAAVDGILSRRGAA